ncbi:hypothetical protein [Lentzea atacamensis]|nr:hypothetical protein [Lentzea atacamensis]
MPQKSPCRCSPSPYSTVEPSKATTGPVFCISPNDFNEMILPSSS